MITSESLLSSLSFRGTVINNIQVLLITDSLSLNQSTATSIHYQSINDLLILTDIIKSNIKKVAYAEKVLLKDNVKANKIYSRTLHDILSLGQYSFKGPYQNITQSIVLGQGSVANPHIQTLTLSDSLSYSVSKPINDIINLVQTVACVKTRVRTLSQTIGLASYGNAYNPRLFVR